jgi:hypothetical protein
MSCFQHWPRLMRFSPWAFRPWCSWQVSKAIQLTALVTESVTGRFLLRDLLRDLLKLDCEWAIWGMTHNINKL